MLKHGIKLACKSSNTLRRNLCKLEDKSEAYENSGIVYGMKCLDCSASYVGKTGRELKLRIKEHKAIQEIAYLTNIQTFKRNRTP